MDKQEITEVKIKKPAKKKSSKYIFTLKNIDIDNVDKKYGLFNTLNSGSARVVGLEPRVTKISELSEINKKVETISFFDEAKRAYSCNVSMIDFETYKELNTLSTYNCYWCRHSFYSPPIGCPISYVSNKITKSFYSEKTKETYTIKENITSAKLKKYETKNINKNVPFVFTALKDKTNSTFVVDKEHTYFTDGIFCSSHCCRAFIKDNKHNPLYDKSDVLLTKMHNDMLNEDSKEKKIVEINPAPHWRLLTEYGGHLSINKFRESFSKISYDFHGILKPCSYLYEEKFTF